ncbi:MAG TPA: hypothetical protein VFA74_13355 [Terriglobales bacterium]|nr:hypothetical protein [Terriglobales bacterium]
MAKTNVFIWHNLTGQILAIGHSTGKRKATPVAREGQAVLETEFEESHLAGLHKTHIVDVTKRTLIKKPA